MRTLFLLSIAVAITAAAAETQNPRTFTIQAPKAAEVKLRGQWSPQEIPFAKGDDGVWRVDVADVPPGVWEYSFSVDGLNVIDPSNPAIKPQRGPAKSILHVASNPPAPWDWQEQIAHGTVHMHSYQSKSLGRLRELVVYTPPGYESGAEKLPLLVLQHGSGDNQRAWVEHGKAHWILDSLIAAGKAKPMIVLMISGHALEVPRGAVERRAEVMEAFRRDLLDDAIPLVEQHYRVLADREQRAITGLSMGAAQSLTVGLNALDRFAWIGAFSGATMPEMIEAPMKDAAGTNAKLKLLWIACGKSDRGFERAQSFHQALEEAQIRHEWHVTEGEHSWPVWRNYLVDFAPRLFQR
jgi:enterochelin esterase family protein